MSLFHRRFCLAKCASQLKFYFFKHKIRMMLFCTRWQVSIFLRDKVQHNNTGRFVLPISGSLPVDVELPGKIRSAVRHVFTVCAADNWALSIEVIVIKLNDEMYKYLGLLSIWSINPFCLVLHFLQLYMKLGMCNYFSRFIVQMLLILSFCALWCLHYSLFINVSSPT